jgi:hypothetical protein
VLITLAWLHCLCFYRKRLVTSLTTHKFFIRYFNEKQIIIVYLSFELKICE